MAEPADAQNHRTAGDTSDILYQVRTLGLSPGVIPESAIDALQKQFRVSQKKAQNLLNNRIVCKPTHNERARALKRKLFKLGVRARVEEVGGALSQDKDSRTNSAITNGDTGIDPGGTIVQKSPTPKEDRAKEAGRTFAL